MSEPRRSVYEEAERRISQINEDVNETLECVYDRRSSLFQTPNAIIRFLRSTIWKFTRKEVTIVFLFCGTVYSAAFHHHQQPVCAVQNDHGNAILNGNRCMLSASPCGIRKDEVYDDNDCWQSLFHEEKYNWCWLGPEGSEEWFCPLGRIGKGSGSFGKLFKGHLEEDQTNYVLKFTEHVAETPDKQKDLIQELMKTSNSANYAEACDLLQQNEYVSTKWAYQKTNKKSIECIKGFDRTLDASDKKLRKRISIKIGKVEIKKQALILRNCPEGDLLEYVTKKKDVLRRDSESAIIWLLKEIGHQLEDISLGIDGKMYYDLKSNNILVGSTTGKFSVVRPELILADLAGLPSIKDFQSDQRDLSYAKAVAFCGSHRTDLAWKILFPVGYARKLADHDKRFYDLSITRTQRLKHFAKNPIAAELSALIKTGVKVYSKFFPADSEMRRLAQYSSAASWEPVLPHFEKITSKIKKDLENPLNLKHLLLKLQQQTEISLDPKESPSHTEFGFNEFFGEINAFETVRELHQPIQFQVTAQGTDIELTEFELFDGKPLQDDMVWASNKKGTWSVKVKTENEEPKSWRISTRSIFKLIDCKVNTNAQAICRLVNYWKMDTDFIFSTAQANSKSLTLQDGKLQIMDIEKCRKTKSCEWTSADPKKRKWSFVK